MSMIQIIKQRVANSQLFVISTTILLLIVLKSQAQTCCSINSSSQEFSMLASNESFTKSHLAPLRFNYVPENGKMISFKTPDGKKSKAFEIRAETATNNYVFVFHEWWGLNIYIKKTAEELQKELGNVNVIALDLYDGQVTDKPELASKIMQQTEAKRCMAIIMGAADYAGAGAKIQTIGWCFGGTWSMQAAEILKEKTTGCVLYYGMPEKKQEEIEKINFPVLGIFGNRDEYINADIVNQFEFAMKAAGKTVEIKRYDQDHAFANPSNPKYAKEDAEDAHKAAVSFLKSNLK